MFFELAPRLQRTHLNIPALRETPSDQTVLEVYPALVTRQLIGKQRYKSDIKRKQTEGMRDARQEVVEKMREGLYGLRLELGDVLAAYLLDDATGDALDAVLCAVQAAWAARQENYGVPEGGGQARGVDRGPLAPIARGQGFAPPRRQPFEKPRSFRGGSSAIWNDAEVKQGVATPCFITRNPLFIARKQRKTYPPVFDLNSLPVRLGEHAA